MAILQATQSGGDYRSYKLETLAPKGTFAGHMCGLHGNDGG